MKMKNNEKTKKKEEEKVNWSTLWMPNKNYTPLDSNSLPSRILFAYKHVYSKAGLQVLLKLV